MVSVGSGSPDEDPPVDSPLYPELEGYLPAPDSPAARPTPGAAPGWVGPGPIEPGPTGPGSIGPGAVVPGSVVPGSVVPGSVGPGPIAPGSVGAGGYGGYAAGRGQVPPARTHEAFKPYVAPRVTRRRRSDWPILVFALIVATLVMAACCIAGFAVYANHGGTFG